MATSAKRALAAREKRVRPKPAAGQKGREKPERRDEALRLLDFRAVYVAESMERISWIKQGVDAGDVLKMALRLEMSQAQLLKLLGLPRGTIVRKAKAGLGLSNGQGERVVGLSRLIGQVEMMVLQSGDPEGFDAADWVARWLDRPNGSLGGRRPADLMDTVAGQALVGAIIASMQSGAYW